MSNTPIKIVGWVSPRGVTRHAGDETVNVDVGLRYANPTYGTVQGGIARRQDA
jgi:hypothetical protein